MRIFFGIISICSAALGTQATATTMRGDELSQLGHGDAVVDTNAANDSFGKTTRLNLSSPTIAANSPSPFSQMLNIIVDTRGLCISEGGYDDSGRRWEYSLRGAECYTRRGNYRAIKIVCSSRVTQHSGEVQDRSRTKTLWHECPVGTFCQAVRIAPGEGPPDEIACVDVPEVTIQPVTTDNKEPEDFCTLTLALPGSQYRARPGVTYVDLILTEQVLFPNGSAYRAPKLFIRDTTTKKGGVNRALRVDASLNSAQVRLTSIGGKLQTKTFEFCMQQLPGMAGRSFTLMYSWFQISSNLRHGRIHSSEDMRDTASIAGRLD